jgi:hypothetical protein
VRSRGGRRRTPPSPSPRTVLTRVPVALLALVSLSASQAAQTFTGTITDDVCAGVGHAQMRMGPTDAECTRACVLSHAAAFVLENGKTIYTLSDQRAPDALAGQKVAVVGVLDARTMTIQVQSMTAAD